MGASELAKKIGCPSILAVAENEGVAGCTMHWRYKNNREEFNESCLKYLRCRYISEYEKAIKILNEECSND